MHKYQCLPKIVEGKANLHNPPQGTGELVLAEIKRRMREALDGGEDIA